VHLPPRIGAEALNLIQRAPVCKRESGLRAPVAALTPDPGDQLGDSRIAGTLPQRLTQIFERSKADERPTSEVADEMAKKLIGGA